MDRGSWWATVFRVQSVGHDLATNNITTTAHNLKTSAMVTFMGQCDWIMAAQTFGQTLF